MTNRNICPETGDYLLGGSDANRIMRGEWRELYREIKGLDKPKDLSQVLAVQIGVATEKVNLDFLQFDLEQEIFRDITVDPDKDKKWLRSSLDGMTDETHTPCEAKHTHSANRLEVVGEYYMPQLQHYMLHTAKDEVYLSVIFGNNRHEYASIPADYTYQKKLIAVESWFIDHLVADKEPETLIADVPKKEAKDIVLNGMKQVDMSNNDKWTAFALQYTELKPVAKTFEEAKKSIKKLVPDDCYRAEGEGVIVTRNKKNILTIKEVNKDGE